MDAIKKMSVAEFREKGFLQELNRQFLHPLGLALEVVINEDGSESFGEVWDYRDDPEGMLYSEKDIASPEFTEKAKMIGELLKEKAKYRVEKNGWLIQPLPTR